MFKFIESDPHNAQKKKPGHACDSCRKRKKRCAHIEDDDLSTASTPRRRQDNTLRENANTFPGAIAGRTNVRDTTIPLGRMSSSTRQGPSPQQSGMLGSSQRSWQALQESDRFIGDLSPEGVFHAATSLNAARDTGSNSVGVWLPRSHTDAARSSLNVNPVTIARIPTSLMSRVVLPILEEEIASALPGPEQSSALTTLYFSEFHEFFPVLDKVDFESLSSSDLCRRLLLQGICLAASKSALARSHLVLPGSSIAVGCEEFGMRISAAMKTTIDFQLVSDRVVVIQALILMSYFGEGPDNATTASLLSAMAIMQAQTIGLHLQTTQTIQSYPVRLLCCLWALDRLNACFYGRPVVMHERDLRTDFSECIDSQSPAFKLFLKVVQILDRVIALYRPQHDTTPPEPDIEIISFEELADQCDITVISAASLATIEVFYHAVVVLAHRSKHAIAPRLSSSSYIRQALSSSIILYLLSKDTATSIISAPFIPYAASLSLSVSYREMRHSKIASQRARARGQFQACCDILERLSVSYCSAVNMAQMGKATLQELDRVLSSVWNEKHRPSTARDSQDSRKRKRGTSRLRVEEEDAREQRANDNEAPDLQRAEYQQGLPPSDVDPFSFHAASNIDLFDMFDPAFDLHGVEAYLQGNLDLSFPSLVNDGFNQ